MLVLAASAPLFEQGCTPKPAAPESCSAAPRTLEPLVVDWRAGDLARFQELAKQGVVVVHADGCSLRPLPQCRAVGTYGYIGVAPSNDTTALDDDLRDFAPGASERIAALGRQGTMRLQRTIIGQWVATQKTTSPIQLQGDCAMATHVVHRVWVGAYDFASGQRSLAMRGTASACVAEPDAKAPPGGCDAWMKVELAPLAARPSPGDACDASMQGCVDSSRALLCASGKLSLVPCQGADGCRVGATGAVCDDTVATPGQPCAPAGKETYACTKDGADALVCRDGSFGTWRHCRGPKRCSLAKGSVDCDTSVGAVGDPCEGSAGVACSANRSMLLRCDGGKLVKSSACRGPGGCALDQATFEVSCDRTRERVGDPCDQPDGVACSDDGRAQLACRGGIYAEQRACPKGCSIADGKLRCGS